MNMNWIFPIAFLSSERVLAVARPYSLMLISGSNPLNNPTDLR